MQVTSSVYAYTLSVQLPAAIQPEMVTVCANKGDKIKVVADVWHLEDESECPVSVLFLFFVLCSSRGVSLSIRLRAPCPLLNSLPFP
jgi:hypothetical protein